MENHDANFHSQYQEHGMGSNIYKNISFTVCTLGKNNAEWSQYQIWLSSLKGLINKIDFLDIENSYSIRSGLINIIDAIEKDGYSYIIDRYGYYMWVKLPSGVSRAIFDYDYGINNNAVIHRVFDDKIICGEILEFNNIPTPRAFLLVREKTLFSNKMNNTQSAIKFAEKVGYPLIMKPINGSQGRGVKKIVSYEHLMNEIEVFNGLGIGTNNIMLQEFITGNDVRVIYLDGNIELAYQRIPAMITGDGNSSILQLIGEEKFLKHKDSIEQYLLKEGIGLDEILSDGENLQYIPTANVSTGGSVVRYDFDDEDINFIKNIGDQLGARYFGADILTQGKISDGIVLELNKMPGTTGANIVENGFSKKLGSKIWQIIKKDEGIN